MRSSTLLPRSRVGACSPRTQRIASTTLDFPHPLGPTTAVIPAEKPTLVGSRNDLKPTKSRLLSRIPSPPPPHRIASELSPKSQTMKLFREARIPPGGGEAVDIVRDWAECDSSTVRGAESNFYSGLFLQLGIPVGAIDRRQVGHPLAITLEAEHLGAERRPVRANRVT